MYSSFYLARALFEGGMAGLPHLDALSLVVKKNIKVEREGKECLVVGKCADSVVVNYEPGHWTLRGGENAKTRTGHCNCLFDVVGEQTGHHGQELRRSVVKIMSKGREAWWRGSMWLGGAKYDGMNENDAQGVVDASQGVAGYGYSSLGHPRGHASYPHGQTSIDSVENYSNSGMKSGFMSRRDQDVVVHHALISRLGRNAMHDLNQGSLREARDVPVSEMEKLHRTEFGEWLQGERVGETREMRAVTVVLQHQQARSTDPDAPVQIFTCYPNRRY